MSTNSGRDENGRFTTGHEHGFKPGQSGNPSGQPKGITWPGDWLRGLMDKTEPELRNVLNDENQPLSRRAAARQVLATLSGEDADVYRGFNMLCDRTEGKSRQCVDMHHKQEMHVSRVILED